jgi:hypothetical protein
LPPETSPKEGSIDPHLGRHRLGWAAGGTTLTVVARSSLEAARDAIEALTEPTT